MFIDKATVQINAGKGGNGIVSFRRERYVDRGGPDGGDGGDGGDIIFIGNRNINTLRGFRHNQLIKADDGKPGFKAKMHGKNGEDLLVQVPVGTQIFRDEELIGDIIEHEQEVIAAYGGSGGFGNAHFKSSRRQAPKVAENGEEGDIFEARLELKLLADVGLVGLPNAGKSTFLSVVSNAKPEIANYPFTTLSPNLGVADIDSDSLLIADIPGLIEGASDGKGLGDEFLRHVERTAVLLHLVDIYSDDIAQDVAVIRGELKSYSESISKKPIIIALSKTEGVDDEMIQDAKSKISKVIGKSQPIFAISSSAKQGLNEVLRVLLDKVMSHRAEEELAKQQQDEEEDPETTVFKLEKSKDDWTIEDIGKNEFIVWGEKIERFARRTNFENEWGVQRLKDILHKMGIDRELDRKGMKYGGTLYFGKAKRYSINL